MKYCSECRSPLREPAIAWPKKCGQCGQEFFKNPTPVAVAIVPIALASSQGVLTIRRAIPPAVGKMALPGGYVNFGETWQEAAAREVWEETGVILQANEVEHLRTVSVPSGQILIFGKFPAISAEKLERERRLSQEVSEICPISAPGEFAFPTHSEVVADWFRAQA